MVENKERICMRRFRDCNKKRIIIALLFLFRSSHVEIPKVAEGLIKSNSMCLGNILIRIRLDNKKCNPYVVLKRDGWGLK